MRVTKAERARIVAAAKRDRLPLATWLRKLALDAAEQRPKGRNRR